MTSAEADLAPMAAEVDDIVVDAGAAANAKKRRVSADGTKPVRKPKQPKPPAPYKGITCKDAMPNWVKKGLGIAVDAPPPLPAPAPAPAPAPPPPPPPAAGAAAAAAAAANSDDSEAEEETPEAEAEATQQKRKHRRIVLLPNLPSKLLLLVLLVLDGEHAKTRRLEVGEVGGARDPRDLQACLLVVVLRHHARHAEGDRARGGKN